MNPNNTNPFAPLLGSLIGIPQMSSEGDRVVVSWELEDAHDTRCTLKRASHHWRGQPDRQMIEPSHLCELFRDRSAFWQRVTMSVRLA